MRRTLEITEQAMGLQESWPKFAPGGDKKNGYWIALAAYAHGPKGPTAAALREAITKKLSGKSAEATRGKTAYNTPLLPKLRDVFVRGAEIPGVSANSMTEYSDVLVYVVEFDTYIPKLLEIAEGVLEDLVLSKKDEYDWANGPVEPGHSSLHSAAKTLRLDMDSVYSATDARQRRYMGEAVLDESDPARDVAARALKQAMRRVEFLLKGRVANADAVRVLALVPMYMSGRGDTPDDGYLAIAAYRIQRNSEIILVSHRVTFGDGVEPDLAHLHAPFAYTSSVQIDDPSGVANSVKELIGLVKRFDSPLSKALSREGMIKELSAFLRSQGLMEDLQEAVDPQAFGELRSLLASPYKKAKNRRTWLRAVADRVSDMIRAAGKDQDAVDTIVTYADDILGQISDQELLVITPLDAQAVNNRGLAKAQRLEPVAVALMKKHQLAIYADGSSPLSVTPEEDAQDLLKLKIGSVKSARDDGAFPLITDGFSLVDRSDEARDIIAAVARGHKLLRLYVQGSVTFTSLAGTLKDLASITPSGADLAAEVTVDGWEVARRRTGLDPLAALMVTLEQPRNRISGTNGRLRVILSFARNYMVDGDDIETLESAAQAGIITDFGSGGYQNAVWIEFP